MTLLKVIKKHKKGINFKELQQETRLTGKQISDNAYRFKEGKPDRKNKRRAVCRALKNLGSAIIIDVRNSRYHTAGLTPILCRSGRRSAWAVNQLA
ncbi:MAG: hypothetical protein U5K27_02535 [Desulfotignum sp.]|nr:hypothetical protein [Desulfotignum sp.]